MAPTKSPAPKATTPTTARAARPQRKAPATRKAAPSKKPAPTPESIARKLVRFTTGQTARARQGDFYAEDCISCESGAEPITGIEALTEKWERGSAISRAIEWRAVSVFVKSQTICIEWEAVSVGAEGARTPFREIAIHQVRNGAIVEERFYYDPAVLGSTQPETEDACEAAAPSAELDAAPAEAPPAVEVAAAEPAPAPRRPPTPTQAPVDFRGHPPIDPLDL